MKYVEAPERYLPQEGETSLFLAGGISGCADWQNELARMLKDTSLVVLNPRRGNFSSHDPAVAEAQIRWEHHHLRVADEIAFWFPCETLCPITLYELGAWTMSAKVLYIGTHPDYQRRLDVVIQTRLVRPDISIVHTLADLAAQIISAHS
ncbi:MAG: hypothetical protein HC884_07610 [Chloroflexaceae bacterium]|nr:hypothetical protein [Chloroflexaceae bacterium]